MKTTRTLLSLLFAVSLIVCTFVYISADEALAGQDEITVNPEGANTTFETAYPITEFRVTDSLPERGSVRWYSFELTEDCVPIIYMTNETSSAYEYCWYMTVYASDGRTVIKEGSVEGRGRDTVLPLELSAGKYYIRIAMPTTGNPMTNGYSPDSYTLFVVMPSEHRTQDANGVTTVENSRTWICVLDGKVYTKDNPEPAYAALYHTYGGSSGREFTFLILVGETKESVLYSTKDQEVKSTSVEKIKYDGKEYYYHTCMSIDAVEALVEDEMSPPLHLCGGGASVAAKTAAKEILNLVHGEEASSGTFLTSAIEFFKEYWILIVSVIIGIVVLLAILGSGGDTETSPSAPVTKKSEEEALLEYCRRCKEDGAYSSSSGGGGSSTDDDYMDIKNMTDRLNTKGYEPDGWGTGGIPGPEDFGHDEPAPDTESFPDFDNIW